MTSSITGSLIPLTEDAPFNNSKKMSNYPSDSDDDDIFALLDDPIPPREKKRIPKKRQSKKRQEPKLTTDPESRKNNAVSFQDDDKNVDHLASKSSLSAKGAASVIDENADLDVAASSGNASKSSEKNRFGFDMEDLLKLTDGPTKRNVGDDEKNLQKRTEREDIDITNNVSSVPSTMGYTPSSSGTARRPRRRATAPSPEKDLSSKGFLERDGKEAPLHNTSEDTERVRRPPYDQSSVRNTDAPLRQQPVREYPDTRAKADSSAVASAFQLKEDDSPTKSTQRKEEPTQRNVPPYRQRSDATITTNDHQVSALLSKVEERDRIIATLEKELERNRREMEDDAKRRVTEDHQCQEQLAANRTELAEKTDRITSLEKNVENLKEKLGEEEQSRVSAERDISLHRLASSEETSNMRDDFIARQKESLRDLRGTAENCAKTVAQMAETHKQELDDSRRQTENDAKLGESLAQQTNQLASSMERLESQWMKKLDTERAGKIEEMKARELLLTEMEDNAKKCQERSSSDMARFQEAVGRFEETLKGFDRHGTEERERFKKEETRFDHLQKSILEEREQWIASSHEERDRLAIRWSAYEVEKRKMEEDCATRREQANIERSDLNRERSEFSLWKEEENRMLENRMLDARLEETRIAETKIRLERDIALFQQKKEAAKIDLAAADKTREEIRRMRAKLDEDIARASSMGEELSRASAAVAKRADEAEEKFDLADRAKRQGENAKQCALEERNRIELEKAKLGAEVKKMETDRLSVVHERITLLQDKSANRKYNTRANSACGFAGVTKDSEEGMRRDVVNVRSLPLQQENSDYVNGGIRDMLSSIRSQLSDLDLDTAYGNSHAHLNGDGNTCWRQ